MDYPNASDRIRGGTGQLGGDIFIHGDCVTVGCLPLTDEGIEQLYSVADDARVAFGHELPVHLFPARFTDDTQRWRTKQLARDATLAPCDRTRARLPDVRGHAPDSAGVGRQADGRIRPGGRLPRRRLQPTGDGEVQLPLQFLSASPPTVTPTPFRAARTGRARNQNSGPAAPCSPASREGALESRPVRTIPATRYVTPLREGGSLPAIVEADDDGLYVMKFRGRGRASGR